MFANGILILVRHFCSGSSSIRSGIDELEFQCLITDFLTKPLVSTNALGLFEKNRVMHYLNQMKVELLRIFCTCNFFAVLAAKLPCNTARDNNAPLWNKWWKDLCWDQHTVHSCSGILFVPGHKRLYREYIWTCSVYAGSILICLHSLKLITINIRWIHSIKIINYLSLSGSN